ncbi:sulfur oxidation c-type cytochrome SoxX [Lentilitoribacter sp. Alg239-R112]|uniref:sulfur oxidation c-type cytochrome SoxX n=1 Tax=Lentilitoribacter sp. Alg239-R112 TaxID=2305987 RepID=UPI0013A70487|nr:sulfur oxidation c-type cytochrome SoxX [Lentilitoribacter sp. Alg239-R112]
MIFRRGMIAAIFLLAGTSISNAEIIAPENVTIVDGEVAMSLTGSAGNAEVGATVFGNKKLGNCLACHANKDMVKQLFHGDVGPEMDGVADRWEPQQLRAILVNSKAVFGDETVMPGFYSLEVGQDVRKDLIGKTILSAEQIEDVIAYLSTLKE